METKTFEVRDSMTFIPVLATRVADGNNAKDSYLMRRAGFRNEAALFVTRLTDNETQFDKNAWANGTRTLPVAHEFIRENWHDLKSGQVIDVEFILGLSEEPKVSEMNG